MTHVDWVRVTKDPPPKISGSQLPRSRSDLESCEFPVTSGFGNLQIVRFSRLKTLGGWVLGDLAVKALTLKSLEFLVFVVWHMAC